MIHYQIDSLEAQFQNMKVVLGTQWTPREQPPKKSFINGKSNNYSNDQFNPGDYYFAQKRETKTNQALITKRRSSVADKKAREGIGNWFSKGKKLDKNDYSGSKKLISTSSFPSAVEAQDKNRSLGPDIINRAGTENAPQGMSIEDVKRLLGN